MNNYEVVAYGLNEKEVKAFSLAIAKADEAKKWMSALKANTDAYEDAVIAYGMYLAAVKYFVEKSK
jgi:hypothetical protein